MNKKFLLTLLFPLLLSAADYTGKFGFEFSAGPQAHVGFKYHFTPIYALNPNVSFTAYQEVSSLGITIENEFYLPEIADLDHFIFLDVALHDLEYDGINFGAGYGVQYLFNDNIALFGKLGASMEFNDGFQYISLSQSGVGLTFYIR